MKLQYTFDDQFIDIELADTLFINDIWIDNYNKLLTKTRHVIISHDKSFWGKSNDVTLDDLNKIKEDIKNIENIAPFPLYTEFLFKNKQKFNYDFNRLHRCYTSGHNSIQCEKELNWNRNFLNPENDLDRILESISVNSHEKEKLLSLLQKLNDDIHTCDHRVPSDNSFISNSIGAGHLYYMINLDVSFEDFNFFNIKNAQEHISIDRKFNAWVYKDISGKDYLQCFMDDDDPRNPDVHSPSLMRGKIFIDLDNTRLDIIYSQEFKKWVEYYNLDINRAGWFPIGTVTDINIDKKYQNIDLNNITIKWN